MHPLSLPCGLLLLGNAIALTVPSHSLDQRVASDPECQNTSSNLNSLCWDVLNMDAWMQKWNKSTTTCHSDELWANCFMRKAGMPETDAGEEIGCAQVGPNTCPEPSEEREDLASASIEMRYGAYSIWSLQNYMTSIYNEFQTATGLFKIQSTYANLSAYGVTGKSLLAKLLFSEGSHLAEIIGLMVMTDIPIPGSEIAITEERQAPKALGQVLAAYLESFMTNFTLGGFEGCARHGMLVKGETFGH